MITEAPATTPEGRAAQLLRLLDIEAAGDNRFTGSPQPGGEGRVFGGQVIAQGLVGAMRTVGDDRLCHSLHAYFMRGGQEGVPIDYAIDRDFDGGSFSTRRITASQHDRPILTMTASFHKSEEGFTHQDAMPAVPMPEDLMTEAERIEQETDAETAALLTQFQRVRPIEMRWLEHRKIFDPDPADPVAHVWMRLAGPAGDDANIHRAILAYASDMALLSTCTMPHGVNWRTPGMLTASLDHTVWLHDDFRVDDWLLYAMDSPWAGRARGFNRGRFYTRDGRLVASVAQEGLMRMRAR
jgi:acyl-CoA thioesterase II